MAKLDYLLRSAASLLDSARQTCPNCGGEGDVVERKYAVTALRRCASCLLLYRTPTDTPAEAERFYNDDYAQGLTTELPDPAALEAMKAARFAMMENDYNAFAAMLLALGAPAGGKVFDYGCSWGYGSWVLAQHGFTVKSFEISRPRRRFGQQHLGIDLAEDFDSHVAQAAGTYDAFFSSHVLEHVPSPSRIVDQALDLLKPGGLFVALAPNGSAAWRAADARSWRWLWGEVHPNLLDDRFFERALAGRPILLGASPVEIGAAHREHLGRSDAGVKRIGDLAGYELFVAARKV